MLSPQVHWHEGLFLQPHHLQYQQRYFHDCLSDERRLNFAYPYGLIDMRLAPDALENMLVRFDALRVMMPGGVEVNFPHNADLPALDIKRVFEASSQPFVVRLGVPVWFDKRSNVVSDDGAESWRVKRLYRVAGLDNADENTGENARTVMVRRFNARLLLEDDDDADMETLPLLRVSRAAGEEAMAALDPAFVPACLLLRGSPTLRDLVRDVANHIEASRTGLITQITRSGFSVDTMRGPQFEQMLRLRTLNRYAARLAPLVAAQSVTPFELFLELRTLLAELAALSPGRDPFDGAPDYDHDHPMLPFRSLSERIRALTMGGPTPMWSRLEFTREDDVLACQLDERAASEPNRYYLAINTKSDPQALVQTVEDVDRFKLMAGTLRRSLIPGVPLKHERVQPLELPAAGDLHYFLLDRVAGKDMWERIAREKVITARWPGIDTSDYKLTLYLMYPGGG